MSVLLFSACDSDESTETSDFIDWKNSNIASYSFNYVTTGFGFSDDVWRIQVLNAEVIDTQLVEAGNVVSELSIEDAPTIDDLIVSVEDCEDSTVCEVSLLQLDETYGFPSRASFSFGEEGSGFIVSEFEAQ